MPPVGEPPDVAPKGLIIVIVITFILILAAGVLFYQYQEDLVKNQVDRDLTTIAILKSNQIVAWRQDRINDARFFSSRAYLIDGIDHYLKYGDNESRDMTLVRFNEMNVSPMYDNILLVDPQGNVRLSLDPAITPIEPPLLAQVNTSLVHGEVSMTDFHRVPGSGKILLEVIAPLFMTGNGSARPVGAVIFFINPDIYLYPLVQSWPVPSESAETLLIKREGDHVLFLNELRHRSNTALNLTVPLSRTDIPAVMAVMGKTGAFEGRDYRDVNVISVLMPVQDSPWYMVAKVDTDEAYAEWRGRSGLIVALVLGVLAGAVVILGLFWQRRQKYYYRTLYAAEAEKGSARRQYRELFEGVSIGILRSTPGTEGTIIEANPAVLRIFEADSREQFLAVHPIDLYADPGQRRRVSDEILASGAIIGMEVQYKTLKGRPFWGRITAIKKTAGDGSVFFDNTIEDITERKQAEEELRDSEERFRTTLDALVEGCQIIGHDWKYLYVNDAVCRQGRKKREELLGRTMMEVYPGIDTTPLFPILRRCMDERIGKHTENEFLYPDGTSGIFDLIIEPAPEGIFIFSMDITERKKAEVKLQESEERFRVIFERSTVGKSLTAPDGRLLRVNMAFADMLGYTMDEMQHTDFIKITHPDDLAKSGECVRALLAGELASCRMEKRYIHKNGKFVWTDVSTSLLRDNAGTPKYFITIILDITDRKRAEESLRETNEYLQNLIDHANAPIIVWDPAFRITRFNHAFEDLSGRTEEDVIGKHLEILFPESSRKASLEKIQKTLAGERWDIVEIPILHVSEEIRIVLWNSANIVDPEGKIISTIAQGQDITERKTAENALRESEEKYRELFENITAGFALHEIILDDTGKPVDYRFLIVNKAFERMTGLIGADIINRTVLEVLPGTEQYWIETYGEVALSGKPRLFDNYSHVLKKWFEVRVYSPKKGQFATVFTDITGRRTMEHQREMLIKELEEKNAELERFTYTVSHDLKSPLITIKGFASLIEDDARKGDPLLLKKDIHRITDAANTMQALLADLLELSRIGRVVAPPEKTSLATIAREAVDLLAGPLAERGVTVEIVPDLPEVTVDHDRVREVMTNLIENAVKYMGDQPDPLIRVGVDRKGGTPVFFVQDNGIGIKPPYLERIFNLFEKLDPASEGTGVGLTIVRRVIEIHGGKIWAESEGVGKGTTFRFTLPEPGEDRDPGDAGHAD